MIDKKADPREATLEIAVEVITVSETTGAEDPVVMIPPNQEEATDLDREVIAEERAERDATTGMTLMKEGAEEIEIEGTIREEMIRADMHREKGTIDEEEIE
jgi:hypothetical protein